MKPFKSAWSHRPCIAAVVAAVTGSALFSGPGHTADLIGFYAGGALGQAQVEARAPTFGSFKADHSAYQLLVGLRPIAPFGVELEYLDFGHPSAMVGGYPTDLKMNGTAAFAVMYLPLPVLDLYAKAGVARLDSRLTVVTNIPCAPPGCNVFRTESTDSRLAGGVGVQVKLGSWTLRGEYEAFSVSGGTPGMTSIGLMYTLF